MKKLILASIFILSFSFFANGQKEDLHCRSITLNSSHGVIHSGNTRENFNFTVVVDEERQNLEYEWEVEPKIGFSGQGTSSISINTPIPANFIGFMIIATVKIKGLPEGCNNEISDIMKITPRNEFPNDIRSYSRMTLEQEKFIIDDLNTELWKRPGDKGHFLFEIENDEQLQLVKNRTSNILNHIVLRSYDPQKFLFEVCNSNRYATTISFASARSRIAKSKNCEKMDIDLD